MINIAIDVLFVFVLLFFLGMVCFGLLIVLWFALGYHICVVCSSYFDSIERGTFSVGVEKIFF